MRRIRRLLVFGVILIAAYGAWKIYETQALDSEANRLLGVLELRQGSTVGDVGAGSGELTVRMGRRVGPSGRVFATEIASGKLAEIRRAATRAGLGNVTVIEGGERETRLPEECCDAIFLRTVYHHLTDPAAVDASLYRSLRPGGMLAIIDFPPRPILSLFPPKGVPENRGGHGVPLKIVIEEVTAAGFREVQVMEDWTWFHYCVVFRKSGKNDGQARMPAPLISSREG